VQTSCPSKRHIALDSFRQEKHSSKSSPRSEKAMRSAGKPVAAATVDVIPGDNFDLHRRFFQRFPFLSSSTNNCRRHQF
jgi:hypothetical protein